MRRPSKAPLPSEAPPAVDLIDRRDGQEQGPDRRQSVVDRRAGADRRHQTAAETGYTGPERRVNKDRRDGDTGLERRRGPGRRLSDDRRLRRRRRNDRRAV